MKRTQKPAQTPGALPAEFEPERYYDVQLSRIIEAAGVWLSPAKRTVMKGKVAETIRHAIGHAEPV